MRFVVLGDRQDYHIIPYAQFNQLENCQYIAGVDSKSKTLNILNRIHVSDRLLNGNLPFQQVWFPLYYRQKTIQEKTCFIFFSRRYDVVKQGYYEYLKKRHPTAKFVYIFQDIIANHKMKNIPQLKQMFDLIISFDEFEAKRFQIAYFPLIYSKQNITDDIEKTIDVYFVGYAKDRHAQIIETYQQLKKLGLHVDFSVIGVADSEKREYGIHYVPNVPYTQNIDKIRQSKCILEIMQGGGSSSTLRLSEAIAFETKLLTNSPTIRKNILFRREYIYPFSAAAEINDNFVSFLRVKGKKVNYKALQEIISPERLMQFILQRCEGI